MATRPKRVDPARLARLRGAAQLLHRPRGVRRPADVAKAICGAQAQDAVAGRLAFRSRSARLRAEDVDRARTEERSLLRAWAMRGTVHLLATEDAPWLLPLFEPSVADNSGRRLVELGISPATQGRALREIEHSLQRDGPLTRSALAERFERRGIRLDPSTRMHIFRLATARNLLCAGPDAGGQTCLVLARDWLGERPRHDRERALVELARRYLRAFGPATEADFAGWSGLGLRDIRSGLAGLTGETAEVRIGGVRAWRLRRGVRRSPPGVVRLLPAWDTYLMGYRDRGFLAAPADWRRITPGGGILRPTVVRDGVAIGTWRAQRDTRLLVEVQPFTELEATTTTAIEAEVADLGRFEGKPATLV